METRQRPEDIMAQQAREKGADFVAIVKQTMKETSRPVKEKPIRLFHATKASNLTSILENGIQPHDVYGNIYFCDTQKHCLKFVQRPCIILEINTSQLKLEEMFISDDHNKRMFKFDCYTYFENVPPSAVKNWRAF
jgi:hypothetical protein